MTKAKVLNVLKDVTANYLSFDVDGLVTGKRFPSDAVLMAISYLLNRNHLLIGDPGWAKTTSAQIIASKFSGIPFDLFESLTMHGNPGVFEEKLIGRPDFGKLAKGEEAVIWQGCFGLDSLIVDEVNRIPGGTQAMLLEGIRTGRWSYMNDTLFEGKKPTFLTMNYADDGNGKIIPPLEDRIDCVTEQKPASVFTDFLALEKARERDLCNHVATSQILESLKQKNYAAFQQRIDEHRKPARLTFEEKNAIVQEIEKIPIDNAAHYFLWTFIAELNYNEHYGSKRSSDPISSASHDKNYAGVNVKRSFSARPQNAVRLYSKALAWMLGDEKVLLDHVRYVLPHVSAHRLSFTPDYKNKHGNDSRTNGEDLHLAKCLVDDVYASYQKSIEPLIDIIAKIQKGKKLTPDELKGYDHPLMKHLIYERIQKQKCSLW